MISLLLLLVALVLASLSLTRAAQSWFLPVAVILALLVLILGGAVDLDLNELD